jgi:hypothetical protein
MPGPLQALVRGLDAGGRSVHRIGNAGGETAVSLHVYGVGAARVATGVNRVLG